MAVLKTAGKPLLKMAFPWHGRPPLRQPPLRDYLRSLRWSEWLAANPLLKPALEIRAVASIVNEVDMELVDRA